MYTNHIFSSRGTIPMLCCAFAAMFGLNGYASYLLFSHSPFAIPLFLASPSIAFAAVGIALFRSPLREQTPVSHLLSGVFHFLAAGGMIAWAVWQYHHLS